ncbi:helix-turn-helix domain-containing protein [Oxalobacter formigenes]|uniref:helix-turn-helix domain-containing protein n=1 Tax=Oxalobacter formigenes TaxID=847 RepID=UPI0039FBBAA9
MKNGQLHHRAKLTDHDVELIRQLRETGMPYRIIAQKFDVTYGTVGRLCRFERRVKCAHKPE